MVSGRVVRFDEVRGYGFITPDSGGEDVFLHVNDLEVDKRLIVPGSIVEFILEEGDRGPKASEVRLVQGASSRSVSTSSSSHTSATTSSRDDDEDGLCDVLSVKEFVDETTELLLGAAPSVTASQVLQIRQGLVKLAHSHGWVES